MYPIKMCRPVGVWSWGSACVKTYVLATDTSEIDESVLRAAQETLDAAVDEPTTSNEVGFVIVHSYGRPSGETPARSNCSTGRVTTSRPTACGR